MTKICQGVESLIDHKDHTSAVAAIAAVRTAVGYIFFSSERHVAISAFAADDRYLRSIRKHLAPQYSYKIE